jgi:hypothetical protein
MKKIILFAIFLFTLSLYAQDPNILWQRTIGGSEDDTPFSLIQTNDGGTLIGGYSDSDISGDKTENSRGGKDYWIVKLDGSGNIQWQKTYGGNNDDTIWTVIETSDGGFMAGGFSDSDMSGDKTENSQGNLDFWVLKLDSAGNIQWQNTIGGNGIDRLRSIIETDDEYFILGGSSSSDISGDRTYPLIGSTDTWLVWLNSSGSIIYQKSFGFGTSLNLYKLAKTNDGGSILSATLQTTSDSDDFAIIKINNSGITEWQKFIGGSMFDSYPEISQTQDSGYILAGASDSNISGDKSENSQGSFDYWVVKLDENGNVIWQNTIGGSEEEQPYSIFQTADGGYFICGFSPSNISGDKTENSIGESDIWILKLNNVGIIEWQNTIGGSEIDGRPRAIQTTDGSFLIATGSSSNISGDKNENSRGNSDFWIIKHAAILGLEGNLFNNAITLYPNPTKNALQISTQDKTIDKINIYTITGSKILQLEVNTVSPTVDISSLAAGVYYVQLYSGKNVALKKFVKE